MFIPLGLLQKEQIKQEDQFPCPPEVPLLSLEGKVQIHLHKLRKLLRPLSCLCSAEGQRDEVLAPAVTG